MGTKKTSGAQKQWKLAGEPVCPPTMSKLETQLFSDIVAKYNTNLVRTLLSKENSGHTVTAATARTRESAARAFLGPVFKRYETAYDRELLVRAIAAAVCLPLCTVERCSEMSAFLLGAALWFLDYFSEYDQKEELFTLLSPCSETDLHHLERVTPPLSDCVHSQTEILQVMSVLCQRKDTRKKDYRKLLSLVDRATTVEVKQNFYNYLLDYLDGYLELANCARAKPTVRSRAPMALATVPPAVTPPAELLDPEGGFSAIAARHTRKERQDVWFLLATPVLLGCTDETLRQELPSRKAVDLLRNYYIPDPYEMCAAYLILEQSGDLLASLNCLTAAVVVCAERQLPWSHLDTTEAVSLFESECPDYHFRYPALEQPDPEEKKASDTPEMQKLYSDAQLFYSATHYTLPRSRTPSEDLIAWFQARGMEEARARELSHAAVLCSYIDDLWETVLPEPEPDREEEPVEEALPPEPEQEASTEALLAQIAELTRKLKEAQRALHASERSLEALRKQQRAAEEQAGYDRNELAELRNTLFLIQENVEYETEDTSTIELPWQITRRVLIFGGHESWRKAIRPMLPGARFYDREMLMGVDAIKGADVVWIQSNALSHKYYYSIIETARKESIPVRYFAFASARKCAEQVVTYELTGT